MMSMIKDWVESGSKREFAGTGEREATITIEKSEEGDVKHKVFLFYYSLMEGVLLTELELAELNSVDIQELLNAKKEAREIEMLKELQEKHKEKATV